jgi:hypothetical protein
MAALLLMASLTGVVLGVAKNITRIRFVFNVVRRVAMPSSVLQRR